MIDDFDIVGVKVCRNFDLTKYSTMQLKAFGDIAFVSNKESLKNLLITLKNKKIPYQLLGLGANSLLEENFNGIYIKLEFDFDEKELDANKSVFTFPASLPLRLLTSFAIKNNLKGWEVFTGIPATLGGACFMNAGTNLGEIKEIIYSVEYLSKENEFITREVNSGDFSYRKNNFLKEGEVITEIKLKNLGSDSSIGPLIKEYLKKRTDSQPLDKKTCGCIFKNQKLENADKTCPAGKYIDIMGLKGLNINGMRISPVHGNFFENFENSTKKDVLELIRITQFELELNYGIKFETEAIF